MKIKLLIMLMTLTLSGCQLWQNPTIKTKPIEIDGLGSLSLIKDKELDEEQITKVVKIVVRRNIVNEEDANAMLEIYKKNSNVFLNASTIIEDNDKIVSAKDVENYLVLLLEHKSVRNEVHLTTQEIITQKIKKSAKFETDLTASSIGDNVGTLAGGYINAFNKTVTDNSEEKGNLYGKQQAENKFNVINGFEQAATEKIQSETITAEEKENIEPFIADLKAYNESLSADKKILDGNGRLINPAKMTDRQKDSMEDIFSNETNKAGQNLNERMRPTYERLVLFTEKQVGN